GAADGDATDGDGLAGANVPVGETGAGVAGGQAIAGHPIVRQSDRGSRRAVIGLVGSRGADRQRASGDVGQCCRAGGSQVVVGSVQTAQAQARGGDGLGRADRFGGEAGGAAAEADIVASQRAAQGTGSDHGGCGAVINLAVGSDAAGDGGFGHVKGAAGGAGQ